MEHFKALSLVVVTIFASVSLCDALEIPQFIKSVPSGHFAGVSAPSPSLQVARKSAIADAAIQILGCINAEYDHLYQSKISGNPKSPRIHIIDEIEKTASGTVLGIERHIVRSAYSWNHSGEYIFFILVEYPNTKISEMRRLSKRANLTSSVKSRSGSTLQINIAESNGVKVTITSIKGAIHKTNLFAGFYNFCIWKVPNGSEHSFSIAVDPIQICQGSAILKLDIRQLKNSLKNWLLGSTTAASFTITGFDEIGRPVKTSFEY